MKGQKGIQREEAKRLDRIMRMKNLKTGSDVAIDGGAHRVMDYSNGAPLR